MDGMEGLSSLFQNKLFLQMLSGLGGDLAAFGADTGKGFQPTNVNAATQQNISSQNFANLLKQLLSSDDSKATIDKSGIKLSVPQTSGLFSSILGGGDLFKPDVSLAPDAKSGLGNLSFGGFNPFSVGQSSGKFDISALDLTGLTPEMISSALSTKFTQDQLKQKSYTDLVDSMYKMSQIESNKATQATAEDLKRQQIEESKARAKKTERETPSIPITGISEEGPVYLTPSEYISYSKLNKDEKTQAVKNYEYAKAQGFTGSFVDFQNSATTAHKKDYDEAVKSGYKGLFHQWLMDMAKAGAINLSLGEKLEEKKAVSKISGQLYFNDPKWTTDLGRHLSSEDVQNTILRSKEPGLTRAEESIKFIEGKIRAGGGEIIDAKLGKDGVGVWTVKWPGEVKSEEIKYKLK